MKSCLCFPKERSAENTVTEGGVIQMVLTLPLRHTECCEGSHMGCCT